MSTRTTPYPRGPPGRTTRRRVTDGERPRPRTRGAPPRTPPALRPPAQTGTVMNLTIALAQEAVAAAAAPVEQAGSTGPALVVVLGLVLIVAVGKMLRRMAAVVA